MAQLMKMASDSTENAGNTLRKPRFLGRGMSIAKQESPLKIFPSGFDLPLSMKGEKQNFGRAKFLEHLNQQKELKTKIGLATESTHKEKDMKPPTTPNLDNKFSELTLNNNPPVAQKGECGEKIELMTNYVALKVDPGKSIFEYFVEFNPELDYVAFRFKLINMHFKSRKGIRCYDGGTKLYLPEKLSNDKIVIDTKHPSDESPISIIITHKQKMSLGDCEYLYNILFNNCAKVLNFARLGRKSYDFRQSHQIPQHLLEVWPGYITSVKEVDGGLLLCCDIRYKVLRSETAYAVLNNIAKFDPNNFRTIAARELLGQCVLTRYNNSVYRIDDIDWNQTPLSTFKLSSGEEISFLHYYKKQYNIDIRDLKQPVLISRPKKKRQNDVSQLICLIPEICHMTGLTDKMRNDFRVMKDISSYTRITPAQRAYSFKKFLNNIRSNEDAREMLKEWGLTISDELLETTGRILPMENIQLKNKATVPSSNLACWRNGLKTYGLLRSVDLKYWVLIHTQKDMLLANKFCQTIKRTGVGLGIDISEPNIVQLQNDRIESYIEGLKKSINSETQLVICLCPTSRTDRYSAIKKFCCRDIPVPSQVLNSTTIMRENRMIPVVQNVAIQINNKLGGASWTLHIPLKNCMVCGIDTYHQRGSNSVGAFVASLDSEYTRWFSRTCIQEPNQELLDGLVCCFIAALKKYLILNHMLPDRIFIFRDGIGDGMLFAVRNHEVVQFIEACRLLGKDYNPKLSFIIVSKRINTKFYRLTNSSTLDNPCPGAILDHTVIKKNMYNFFLVSQHVTCGTATPTHYLVLYDTSNLKPDHMQRLTYKFCHMYFNWPGTVRVPAPCLYAHKLAYLVGENIKGPVSEQLEDKLFYL